jgi:hypothetical protein
MTVRRHVLFLLFTLHYSLFTVLTGCESVQKKFVRKSKPHVRPSPIIGFQDYTKAMTPLDRYRKHYALFDYWNAELLDALGVGTANPKRIQRASAESLQELKVLPELLQEGPAAAAGRLIKEREEVDRQLQRGSYPPLQLNLIRRTLETQTRQIHRELFWRKVEEQLQTATEPTPHASAD